MTECSKKDRENIQENPFRQKKIQPLLTLTGLRTTGLKALKVAVYTVMTFKADERAQFYFQFQKGL